MGKELFARVGRINKTHLCRIHHENPLIPPQGLISAIVTVCNVSCFLFVQRCRCLSSSAMFGNRRQVNLFDTRYSPKYNATRQDQKAEYNVTQYDQCPSFSSSLQPLLKQSGFKIKWEDEKSDMKQKRSLSL